MENSAPWIIICPRHSRRVSHLVQSPLPHMIPPPQRSAHCYPQNYDPHLLALAATVVHAVQSCVTHHSCHHFVPPHRSVAPLIVIWVPGTYVDVAAHCRSHGDCGNHRCSSPTLVDNSSCAAWPWNWMVHPPSSVIDSVLYSMDPAILSTFFLSHFCTYIVFVVSNHILKLTHWICGWIGGALLIVTLLLAGIIAIVVGRGHWRWRRRWRRVSLQGIASRTRSMDTPIVVALIVAMVSVISIVVGIHISLHLIPVRYVRNTIFNICYKLYIGNIENLCITKLTYSFSKSTSFNNFHCLIFLEAFLYFKP